MTQQRRHTVDRILDIIDGGLQTPKPDPTFGEVSPRNVEECARCSKRQLAEDSDFCDACRAYLLGDSETAPPTVTTIERFSEVTTMEQIRELLIAGAISFNDAITLAARALSVHAAAIQQHEPVLGRPLRCFGGPLDGQMRVHAGQYLRIAFPSQPSYEEVEYREYRIERIVYRVPTRGYNSHMAFLSAVSVHCTSYVLVAEDYPVERITDQLNVIAALPNVLNRWARP